MNITKVLVDGNDSLLIIEDKRHNYPNEPIGHLEQAERIFDFLNESLPNETYRLLIKKIKEDTSIDNSPRG